jgi:carbon monoxide dehydrogenase subunit G
MWIPGVKDVEAIGHPRYGVTVESVVLEIKEHCDGEVRSEGNEEYEGTFAQQMV